jgi:thioredoxin-related protein
VNLGQEFEEDVKFVRINISQSDSGTQDAARRYGVRATPTFVLFDAAGQIRGQVPGWPGYEALTGAFAQLLTDG